MARPIWTGNLSFGLLNVPVSLMSGERRTELQFRMLDSRGRTPVRQERVDADTAGGGGVQARGPRVRVSRDFGAGSARPGAAILPGRSPRSGAQP